MKFPKPAKLTSNGLSHLLVPLVVVVAVAIGGTAFLVASHASPGFKDLNVDTSNSVAVPTKDSPVVLAQTAARGRYARLDVITTKRNVYWQVKVFGCKKDPFIFFIRGGANKNGVENTKSFNCGPRPTIEVYSKVSYAATSAKAKYYGKAKMYPGGVLPIRLIDSE